MTTRETAPVGAPCWVELATSDPDKSREFYRGVFGWEADPPSEEFGGYFSFYRDGRRIAGCMTPPDGVPRDVWGTYLASADATKTVEVAAANGGQVWAPAMAVGDLGTMAWVGDPGGAGVGIWQPGTHPGFQQIAEAGAPSWFGLEAADYAASLPFYRTVFGWDLAEVPGAPCPTSLASVDGAQVAMIADAHDRLEGRPPNWNVFFGADGTQATLDRIVELGGSVVAAVEHTEWGDLAVAADSTGATFNLVDGDAS